MVGLHTRVCPLLRSGLGIIPSRTETEISAYKELLASARVKERNPEYRQIRGPYNSILDPGFLLPSLEVTRTCSENRHESLIDRKPLPFRCNRPRCNLMQGIVLR